MGLTLKHQIRVVDIKYDDIKYALADTFSKSVLLSGAGNGIRTRE